MTQIGNFCIKISKITIDYCIAFAVAIQSPLILLQHVLIDIVGMDAENSTKYRVLLTAIPMAIAIILGFYRNKKLYVCTYFFFFLLLLYNIVIFPHNQEYILSEAIRFTLPVVIPSCLCLLCLSNIFTFEKILYYVSWITFGLALYYVLSIVNGTVKFSGYNMNFSYGLLLPMVSLYSRKNIYSIFSSLLLLVIVIALGSRGAAVAFFLFIMLDFLLFNKKYIPLFVSSVILVIFLIPFFLNFLDDLGLSSRTLMLLLNGELDKDSGRNSIYQLVIVPLKENPILGLGLWGDRFYIDGYYCHNILLEICLNFGLVLGSFLIMYLVSEFLILYFKTCKEYKIILLKYLLACVLPLMVSNSYLIAPNFGIFIGILYSIKTISIKQKNANSANKCNGIIDLR